MIYNRDVAAGTSGETAEPGTLCESGGDFCSGNGVYNATTHACECDEGFSGNDCQYECDADTVSQRDG